MSKPLGRPPRHGVPMIRRTFWVQREVWEKLKAEAKGKGMTLSDAIRERLTRP